MKELHVDSGCTGLLCGVIGQQCVALFLWGALVSRVSWKQFFRVEIWRQSFESVERSNVLRWKFTAVAYVFGRRCGVFGQWSVEWVWVMESVTSSHTSFRYLGVSTLPRYLWGTRETPVDTTAGLLAVLELTI